MALDWSQTQVTQRFHRRLDTSGARCARRARTHARERGSPKGCFAWKPDPHAHSVGETNKRVTRNSRQTRRANQLIVPCRCRRRAQGPGFVIDGRIPKTVAGARIQAPARGEKHIQVIGFDRLAHADRQRRVSDSVWPSTPHHRVDSVSRALVSGAPPAVGKPIRRTRHQRGGEPIDIEREEPHALDRSTRDIGAHIHFAERPEIRNSRAACKANVAHRERDQSHPRRTVMGIDRKTFR